MSQFSNLTKPAAELDVIGGLYDLSAMLHVVRRAMADLGEEYTLVTEGEGQRRFGDLARVVDLAAGLASDLIEAGEMADRKGGVS